MYKLLSRMKTENQYRIYSCFQEGWETVNHDDIERNISEVERRLSAVEETNPLPPGWEERQVMKFFDPRFHYLLVVLNNNHENEHERAVSLQIVVNHLDLMALLLTLRKFEHGLLKCDPTSSF